MFQHGLAMSSRAFLFRNSGARILTLPPPPPPVSFDWFASPTGSAGNSGTIDSPWSLAHVLSGANGFIGPGDVVALRGGTYGNNTEFLSSLVGSQANPIILRQYPAERARINGNLVIFGSDTWYWGFEVFRSANPLNDNTVGIANHGPRCRLIHCIIHDASATGTNADLSAPDAVLYGCIAYNNGTHINTDHGCYITNQTGTKLIKDNINFNNWAYNYHEYDSTAGHLTGISHIGNVAFGGSSIQFPANTAAEYQFGGIPVIGGLFNLNMCYNADRSRWAARFGYVGDLNSDLVLNDNYLVGYTTIDPYTTLAGNRNIFYGGPNDLVLETHGSTGGYAWANNQHFSAGNHWAHNGAVSGFAGWKSASGLGLSDTNPGVSPSGIQIFIRPSDYEAGRANIIIYNWAGLANVNVDLSSILTPGQAFTIVNVQDFFGTPVVSGTYLGGLVTLPMAGITPPAPTGRAFTSPPVTGPTFQVFVVRLQGT